MLQKIIMAVLIINICITAQNYFPLKHGNKYQYLHVWNDFPVPSWDSSFIKVDIADGDTINGQKFYRLIVTGYERLVTFNPDQQFMHDSLQQKLFVKLPGDPQVRLAVDFNIPAFGSYTSYIVDTPLVFNSRGSSTAAVFGEVRDYHSIEWHDWSGMDQSYDFGFASDIGLTDWHHTSLPTGGGFYDLVAAVIDSTVHSGPFRIDSITPSGSVNITSYPLRIYTYYTIDHFSFIDSFYLHIKQYRNGILVETFIKNVPLNGPQNGSVTLLDISSMESGDILKLRTEVSDTCMLNHFSVYPDTGWIEIILTGGISGTESLPEVNSYSLEQNYPNPCNPVTTITYSIPFADRVILTIYDMLGKEIVVLLDEEKNAGEYNVNFNAIGLSSGIYFYKLQSNGRTLTRKMVVLK